MHPTKRMVAVRAALVVTGIFSLSAAAGFTLHLEPFAEIWPLDDAVAVDRFLGAYLAGIGASLLWIGISGELRAAVAGAISLTVVYISLAIKSLTLPLGPAGPHLRPVELLCVVAACISAGIALWFRRFRIRDRQPLPRLVQIAFVVFVLLLAVVGLAMQFGLSFSYYVALGPAAAALVGSSFLGSAAYFLCSLVLPVWGNARAQLWGFLAYDLVLLAPLASRLSSVDAAHWSALVVYVAVLVLSGMLAIYYLLIAPAMRV
jgi:hypothetical protein